MTFVDFIKKYYLPQPQKEIYFVLNNLGIYNDIENSLNDFYHAAENKNKNQIISNFALTSRELVTYFYKSLCKIKPGKQKTRTEQKIAELAVYLIRDTYQHSGLELFEYFELLIQTARKTYTKHSWNFSVLEKLLNFDNIKALAIEEKEKKPGNTIKLSKPVKLNWQGDKQLDLFVDDLTKIFQGVKTKKQVYLLFDTVKTDFKIELPSKHLLPFLTLFHDLHDYGAIKVIGNRGLFVYLHQHLQAPPNDKFPKRDFRKLRHDAKYNEILKNNISMVIKPLLDKYCSNGH
jgi:hypothetical protein